MIEKKPPLLEKFNIGDKWITFGSDPEIFLTHYDNSLVSSEAVIPFEGITIEAPKGLRHLFPGGQVGKIVRDGIQVELHPVPNECREIHSTAIAILIRELHNQAQKHKVEVSHNITHKLTKAQFKALSSDAQMLGCNESFNYHEPDFKLTPTADTALIRSAGGHIHLGLPSGWRANPPTIVPLLDILVGNLGVILDPDKDAATRRINYGRAGEFRLPFYGLEYRVLSNFWLRSYMLQSLFFGMARSAAMIAHVSARDKTDYADRLIDAVNMRSIIRAINTADKDLAIRNFKRIVPFIRDFIGDNAAPIHRYNVVKFVDMLNKLKDYIYLLVPQHGIYLGFNDEEINKISKPGWAGCFADLTVKGV